MGELLGILKVVRPPMELPNFSSEFRGSSVKEGLVFKSPE
jgi:hypothetical protein